MGKTDYALRDKAIPFQGQVFGYNSSARSQQQVRLASDIGDLYFLTLQQAGNTLKLFNVRLLRPFYGQITQAYFTLDLKTSPGQANSLGVYLGAQKWNNDYMMAGEFDQSTTELEARIKAQHKAIFGHSNPIMASGGRLQINAANIISMIPKEGAVPDRSSIHFGISLLFATAPDQTAWELNKFKVDASSTVGL